MGVYFSRFEKPCPACKTGTVFHTFISVSPMTSTARCGQCGKDKWDEGELSTLGGQVGVGLPRQPTRRYCLEMLRPA